MAQQEKTPSLQDILKRRQRSDFVGREEQITLFRQNLALPLDDDRRRFIFNVAGQGNVGKTWLLRHFRHLPIRWALLKAGDALTGRLAPNILEVVHRRSTDQMSN